MSKVRGFNLIILIILVLALALSIVTATFAIWKEAYSDEFTSEIEPEDFNPSLKHIVFSGLDSEGNFTSEQNAVSFAAVGYTGLVAELEIPSVYKYKPVTAILTDSAHIDVSFVNNNIIKSIVIPLSVTRIGESVFANLTNLEEVTLVGDETLPEIAIGNYAFMATTSLEIFNNQGRTIEGELQNIFFMSNYTI